MKSVQRMEKLKTLVAAWKVLGGKQEDLAPLIDLRPGTLRNYLRYGATRVSVERARVAVTNLAKKDLVVEYLSENQATLDESTHESIVLQVHAALREWVERRPACVRLPEGVHGALVRPSGLSGLEFILTGSVEDEIRYLKKLIHELQHKLDSAEARNAATPLIAQPRKTFLREKP